MSGIAYNRPAGGRGSKPYASGAGRQTRTTVGNTDYIIKAWDQVVALTSTLSDMRTWTLPTAASVSPGKTVTIEDSIGGVNDFNLIEIVPAGSDTITGGFGNIFFTETSGRITFTSNGSNAWTCDFRQANEFRSFVLFDEGIVVFGDAAFNSTTFQDDVSINGDVDIDGTLSAVQIRQSAPLSPLGYDTGAGGTVTQNTSKSTAVTINKPCGAITTDNAALTGFSSVNFIVDNSTVTTGDVIVLAPRSAAYGVEVADVGPGFFIIRLTNVTAGSLSQAVIINFAVLNVATT